jgi:hypothetical protein
VAVEAEGSPCDDRNACTIGDHCSGASSACDRGVPDDTLCGNNDDNDVDCVRGYCDARSDRGCSERPEPLGAPCDDGVTCTDQYCLSGQCVIIPLDSRCDDHDADADCIRGDCDPDAGCILAIEPDSSPCEDGIACTGSDYCLTGQCYGGLLYDFLCPNQDYCDNDCIQYFCEPVQGCVAGVEFESAPCFSNFCAINGVYSACNAAGACECRAQPPPDFGCP